METAAIMQSFNVPYLFISFSLAVLWTAIGWVFEFAARLQISWSTSFLRFSDLTGSLFVNGAENHAHYYELYDITIGNSHTLTYISSASICNKALSRNSLNNL